MYDEDDGKQLELFDDYASVRQDGSKVCKTLFGTQRSTLNLPYEQIIFLSCGAILLFIVAFSLGAEMGKSSDSLSKVGEADAMKVVPDYRKISPMPNTNLAKRKKDKAEGEVVQRYVVQLVTYKNEQFARRELDRLKKGGFVPLLRTSGDYYLVYLIYDNKKDANSSVKSLKRRYQDCFVKKLREG